jgi:hypothetical protein
VPVVKFHHSETIGNIICDCREDDDASCDEENCSKSVQPPKLNMHLLSFSASCFTNEAGSANPFPTLSTPLAFTCEPDYPHESTVLLEADSNPPHPNWLKPPTLQRFPLLHLPAMCSAALHVTWQVSAKMGRKTENTKHHLPSSS